LGTLIDRPYIHINCAATMDGRIALPDGSRLAISSPWDKARVHSLRAQLGSILVGAGTIISDDPKLNVNPDYSGTGAVIAKIVLDGRGRIPASARFLRTEGRSIVLTSGSASEGWAASLEEVSEDVSVVRLGDGPDIPIAKAWSALSDRGIHGVLVEGGSHVISSVLSSGAFDIFTVYTSPMIMGGSGPAIVGGAGFPIPIDLRLTAMQIPPGGGVLAEYKKV